LAPIRGNKRAPRRSNHNCHKLHGARKTLWISRDLLWEPANSCTALSAACRPVRASDSGDSAHLCIAAASTEEILAYWRGGRLAGYYVLNIPCLALIGN